MGIGTLGDLDPLLAAGTSLRSLGHDVVVGVPENLCARAKEFGFPTHPICGDISEITRDPARTLLALRKTVQRQVCSLREIAQSAAVIVGAGFPFAAPSVAEYYGVPYVYMVVSPAFVPESGLLPYLGLSAPGWLTQVGWWYQGISNDLLFRSPLDRSRSEMGIGAGGRVFQGVFQPQRRILAFPGLLAGRLANANGCVSFGFLRVTPQGSLPEGLDRFLKEGAPPLVVALGSSRIGKARRLVLDVICAAEECSLRTVVAGGWSDSLLGDLPEGVFRCPPVPYGLLFERAAMVVHHGGAGTFALATSSGKAQVTLPGFADQYYWAKRAQEIGVAPPMIPRALASRKKISKTIREAHANPGYRVAAEKARDSAIGSNGAADAAQWLNALAQGAVQ